MRRLITVLLLVGIVAAAGWTLFREGLERAALDPWRMIPADAAVVVEVSDPLRTWDRWTSTSLLWKRLLRLSVAAELDAAMGRIAAIAENDPGVANAISASKVLVAISPGSGTSARALFVLPMADAKAWEKIAIAINGSGKDPALRVGWRDGLGFVSTDAAAVEAGVMKAGVAGGAALPVIEEARATLSSGSEAHVVANTSVLARLLAQWFKAEAVDGIGLHQGWAAFDLRVRPEAVLLSGLLDGAIDTTSYHTAPFRPSASRSLPAVVHSFTQFNLGDAATWIDAHGGSGDAAARALLDWSDGRITIAATNGDSTGARHIALFGTTDPEFSWRSLAALCDSDGCDTMRYRDLPLVRMGQAGAMEEVLGPSFAAIEQPWYTVIGSDVLFSDDAALLRSAIDAWMDGGGLGDDMAIAGFFEEYAGDAEHARWWQLPRSRPPLIAMANDAAAPVLRSHATLFNAFGNVLLTRSPAKDGRSYLSIALETGGGGADPAPNGAAAANTAAAPGTLWRIDLPAPIARKPWIVRNHANGTREVLAQDQANSIHLISATGRLLWSRALDGPVLGDVRQVDRFRNGKLQLLFNTGGAIHLIDRNGKDLPGFPVKMTENASAPLAAINYDGDRDYRILLPTVEGRVLNFDMNGKAVEGWSPPVLPHVATEPVRFLRVHGKDHLLVIDGAGGLHVWDRRGATRYTPKLTLNDLAEVIDIAPGMTIGATTITWLSRDGAQRTASFDGKKSSAITEPADHVVLAEESGKRLVIRSRANELTVISGDKSRSRSFDAAISEAPLFFDLGDRWLVGVITADGAHLLDAEAVDLPGSPFATRLPFSIGDLNLDRHFEVVAGSGAGIVAYRLP